MVCLKKFNPLNVDHIRCYFPLILAISENTFYFMQMIYSQYVWQFLYFDLVIKDNHARVYRCNLSFFKRYVSESRMKIESLPY